MCVQYVLILHPLKGLKNVGTDENKVKGKECSCKIEERKNKGKGDGVVFGTQESISQEL